MSNSALARSPDDRRALILAAAERAFVRHGFHATTMSHVAEEAGMSAGNLYRYFPSKEAIVEGLCAAENAERAADFLGLARARDVFSAMTMLLEQQILARPPEKARMIVEIWAEAGRNPRVAAITQAVDADVMEKAVGLMRMAKATGSASADMNAEFAAKFLFTLVAGLFKRLATEPNFDVAAEIPLAQGALKALFSGALQPSPAASGKA